MEIIKSASAMTAWSNRRIKAGASIAFVPTMGCLHDGHIALIKEAARRADEVVVSIFVNPLQFGPNEDFSRYPRPFAADCGTVAALKTSVLFTPEAHTLYPEGFSTSVTVQKMTDGLCGASRPGHFTGVTTVVAKLFNIIKPTVAVFGQKDFQQLAVIKAMVQDLDFNINIIGHEIVREADGLAMSSRNRYLTEQERSSALCLAKAITSARQWVAQGLTDCRTILERIQTQISTDPQVIIDYLAIVHDTKLTPQSTIDHHSILAMAVTIGSTRLIDNGHLISEE